MNRKKRNNMNNNIFKSGSTNVVGERSSFPLRKKFKVEGTGEELTGVAPYYQQSDRITLLTQEQIEQIRFQNNISIDGNRPPPPILDFSDLRIPKKTLEILALNEIIVNKNTHLKIPTPIQMQGIPTISSGRDVILLAETGTGKTVTFLIPSILKLMKERPGFESHFKSSPKILIIVPTRELVEQILLDFSLIFHPLGHVDPGLTISLNTISSSTEGAPDPDHYAGEGLILSNGKLIHSVFGVCGEVSYQYEKGVLEQGVDVLIGTPGRLIHLLLQNNLFLTDISLCVCDEFDKILDERLENQMREIFSRLPRDNVQFVLSSATYPKILGSLAKSLLISPITIRSNILAGHTGEVASLIEHHVIHINRKDKNGKLLEILRKIPYPPVLVFCNSVNCVEDVARYLRENQFHVAPFHAQLDQQLRFTILKSFREGKPLIIIDGLDVLVSTDLGSRGLDIEGVRNVVIYEVPRTVEDFIHRCGRTGRAGKKGKVITFYSSESNIPDDLRTLISNLV